MGFATFGVSIFRTFSDEYSAQDRTEDASSLMVFGTVFTGYFAACSAYVTCLGSAAPCLNSNLETLLESSKLVFLYSSNRFSSSRSLLDAARSLATRASMKDLTVSLFLFDNLAHSCIIPERVMVVAPVIRVANFNDACAAVSTHTTSGFQL